MAGSISTRYLQGPTFFSSWEAPLHLTLLGPERPSPILPKVLAAQGIRGPVALISAGWRHDEARDEPLRAAIPNPVVNLEIYHLFRLIEQKADALMKVYARKQESLRGARAAYRLAIKAAVDAAHRMLEEGVTPDSAWFALPIRMVQEADAQWLAACTRLHAEFEEEHRPLENPLVARTRALIAHRIEKVDAVLVAGGHVGVLRNRMAFFGMADLLRNKQIIAWSAGAMALSERILLYHDFTTFGIGTAEFLDHGLGLLPGAVLLPHARQRLDLSDFHALQILCARLAPARALALQSEAWIQPTDGAPDTWANRGPEESAFFLNPDGAMRPLVQG